MRMDCRDTHDRSWQGAATRPINQRATPGCGPVTLPADAPDAPWLAVQGQCRQALRALQRAGIEAFCPMEVVRVTGPCGSGRSGRSLSVPLLGIYMFARTAGWRALEAMDGVDRVISSGDGEARRAVPMAAGFVEALQAHGDWTPAQLREQATSGRWRGQANVVVGSDIRLADGPFAGFICRVEAVDRRDRVKLARAMMGRMVSFWADAASVRPVDRLLTNRPRDA